MSKRSLLLLATLMLGACGSPTLLPPDLGAGACVPTPHHCENGACCDPVCVGGSPSMGTCPKGTCTPGYVCYYFEADCTCEGGSWVFRWNGTPPRGDGGI